MADEEREHDCVANLIENPTDVSIGGSEVLVWRKCRVCKEEFVTTYEYTETTPA